MPDELDPEPAEPPPSGPHTGRPGTFTVEQQTSVTAHTADGDRILIARRDVQPDAPITTVLAREAAAIAADLLMLAVGCEANAVGLDGPKRAWVTELARRAREMAAGLVPGAGSGDVAIGTGT